MLNLINAFAEIAGYSINQCKLEMISLDKILFIHALSDYHFYIDTEFIHYLDILTPNNIPQTVTLNTSKIYKKSFSVLWQMGVIRIKFLG